jgi:hypothetical protein
MAAIVVALAGCEALDEKGDYYRHTRSSFGNSRTEPGVLVFEATTSGLYPVESAEAEAQRVEWLEDWLKQTRSCPAGYEVLSREPIDPAEVNPQRHDLRYRIRCTAGD